MHKVNGKFVILKFIKISIEKFTYHNTQRSRKDTDRYTYTYPTRNAYTIGNKYIKTYDQNDQYSCTHIHTRKKYESRSL